MKKLLGLIVLLLVLNVRAQVIEYNYTGTYHGMGEGQGGSAVLRGLMVYDVATDTFTTVAYAPNKTYIFAVSTNYQKVEINAPRGVVYTVLVNSITATNQNNQLTMNSDLFKGVNRSLKISTNQTFTFPSVLAGTHDRTIGPGPHGGLWLAESNDTFSFNAARTQFDNSHNLTMAQVVSNYRNYLQSRGYSLAQ